MKSTILTLAASVFMAGAVLSSCQSPGKKVENAENNLQDAKNNVVDARQDLNKAKMDSVNEYQKFKKESDEKITAHEKSIAEFKAKIADEKKENRAIFEKKLAKLEQKNRDMKKKLVEYKEDEKYKWEKFKIAYNRDMDALGNEFKNLTVKKVK